MRTLCGKTISIFILMLMAGVLTNCNYSKSKEIPDAIKFDYQNVSDIHGIDFLENLKILNLEHKDVLFDEIDKIVTYKDRIYLMDNRKTNSIYIYDTTGRFINKIFKLGQGPEEYVQLTDIFIDSEDTSLNIVSRMDKKILKYDLDGNLCLGVMKTPKSFDKLSKYGSGFVGYMANYSEKNEPYNVWMLLDNMVVDKSYFEIPKSWESKSLGGGTVFSSYKNDLFYITPMDNNIYSAQNDFSPKYTFDFGDKNWPSDQKEYEEFEKILDENRDRYIHRLYNFQETDNYLIVHFLDGGQNRLGIYNKESRESKVVSLDPYTDKYFVSFGRIIGFDGKHIYSLVSADDMKESWKGKNEYNDFWPKYSEQIKRLRNEFKEIDEEGNPFLLIHTIK